MDFFVIQMRQNGIEVKRELLGDQPRLIGDLVITNSDDTRGRSTRIARLQKESGEVLLELLDAQVDAFKGSRMVLRGIESKQTAQGHAEFLQAWLCIEPHHPLQPLSSAFSRNQAVTGIRIKAMARHCTHRELRTSG